MSWWNAFKVGSSLLGTLGSIAANKKATKTATASLVQKQQDLKKLQAAAQPGITQQYNTIARQNVLTPAQQTAINTARDTTLTALNQGGLRGSGRATVAAVKDVEGTLRNQYLDANRTRADSAASSLAGNYFNAGTNAAQVSPQIGETHGTNTLATAIQTGKAIGDIGALIADEQKNKKI